MVTSRTSSPSAVAAASPPLGRRRRPQQKRSRETQMRLLEATVACLVDVGYARLTTAAISARAGVSQGALFVHYPTKADVVVAAVESIFAGLARRYRNGLARSSRRGDVVHDAIHVLWRVLTRPEYLATNEVYLAARSDPALRRAIRPMAMRHQEKLLHTMRQMFGDDSAVYTNTLDTLVLAMQAAAIDATAMRDRRTDEARLTYFEALLRRELEAAGRVAGRNSNSASRRKTSKGVSS